MCKRRLALHPRSYQRFRKPNGEIRVKSYRRCTFQDVCGRLQVLRELESTRHHMPSEFQPLSLPLFQDCFSTCPFSMRKIFKPRSPKSIEKDKSVVVKNICAGMPFKNATKFERRIGSSSDKTSSNSKNG